MRRHGRIKRRELFSEHPKGYCGPSKITLGFFFLRGLGRAKFTS
jgi:hypothetical protein